MNAIVRIALLSLGGVVVLAALNFAPMVSLRTPAMREYRSHGMSLFAEPADAAEVERIAARIADSSTRVADALETDDLADIGVVIYPSQAALRRKTVGLVGMAILPDWFIGRNTRNFVLITSPARPGPAHSRESVEQAAVHEYVHVLTDRRNRQLGYWLKEGIALYLAGQRPTPEAIRSHRDVTWQDYAAPDALQFAEIGGYTLAWTLVDYLVEHHGWEAVIELTAPGADYRSVIGVSERELFARWKGALADV